MCRSFWLVALLLTPVPSQAQPTAPPAETATKEQIDNAELRQLFSADQAARQGAVKDWAEVSKADATRRARVRELLDGGAIRTARDFRSAAFIFQHGSEPEDFLLAHALAMRSLGLGMKESEWIAAATLDRYLQAIARDQIYGTQYQRRAGAPATQGRYDPELLTDQLRIGARVETLEEQQEKLKTMNALPTDPK